MPLSELLAGVAAVLPIVVPHLLVVRFVAGRLRMLRQSPAPGLCSAGWTFEASVMMPGARPKLIAMRRRDGNSAEPGIDRVSANCRPCPNQDGPT